MVTTALLDCGHSTSEHGSSTTGYGQDSEGKRYCYDCAALKEQAHMTREGRTVLYLSGEEVTDWPGRLRFRVLSRTTGRHNIARKRYDVWFRDGAHMLWHGVQYGDNTQLLHCKRVQTCPVYGIPLGEGRGRPALGGGKRGTSGYP